MTVLLYPTSTRRQRFTTQEPVNACQDGKVLKVDEFHWKKRYGNAADGPPDIRLGEFTGIPLRAVITLGDEILTDLDTDNFGIRWWQGQLPDRERILISDHLVACVRAISHNLLEAEVAMLEYRHAAQEFDALLQRGVGARGGYRVPQPRGPYDDLVAIREEASIAAIVRSLGSALDCLGGVIVGVAALPSSIVLADLGQARKSLEKRAQAAPGAPADLQAELASAIETAGPPGWLDWLLAIRNTAVHRGRRMSTINSTLERVLPGQPARLTSMRVLPASPALTEVEAWAADGGYFASVLTEPAETTLNGAIESTACVVEAISARLTDLWRLRRDNPGLLAQPIGQWTAARDSRRQRFTGYAPDPTAMIDVTGLTVSDEAERRLKAAGWTSNSASIWA